MHIRQALHPFDRCESKRNVTEGQLLAQSGHFKRASLFCCSWLKLVEGGVCTGRQEGSSGGKWCGVGHGHRDLSATLLIDTGWLVAVHRAGEVACDTPQDVSLDVERLRAFEKTSTRDIHYLKSPREVARRRLRCTVLLHYDMNCSSFRSNNALDFAADLNDRII
jgi:hypothetical protein